MNIFLTGGCGFLGSAICEELSRAGHQIIAFDNFSRKSHLKTDMPNVQVYDGDVRDVDSLAQAMTKLPAIDAIWHFAFINGTSSFYSHPEVVLDVGVKGAINTLDLALKYNIKQYVLCSTSEVYNEPTQVPTPENERMIIPDLFNPRFSYSGGKIISELLTVHYGAKQGLQTKIFRPHNIYGPNMGLEHVIPEIIKKIVQPHNPQYINDQLVVQIQGTGNETRSFCYVDDAATQMNIAFNDSTADTSSVYNIGIENEISISHLTSLIAEILNIPIIIKPTGINPIGGTSRRCPSMKKILKLGYKEQYNLKNGLTKTINWYNKFYLK